MTTPAEVSLTAVPNPLRLLDTDALDRAISVVIPWVPITGLLLPMVIVRAPGCAYRRVLIGRGSDGRADSSPLVIDLQVGAYDISVTTLTSRGLVTIRDVLNAGQITVGW